MKKIFLAALLMWLTLTANANPPTGFYTGLSAGESLFISKQNLNASASIVDPSSSTSAILVFLPYDVSEDLINSNLKGAFCLGFRKSWQNFYLGAELFVDVSHYKAVSDESSIAEFPGFVGGSQNNIISVSTTTKQSAVQYGADLLPGILIFPNTLLYGRVGIVGSQLTIDSIANTYGTYVEPDWNLTSSFSHTKTVTAPRVGIGIEQFISKGVGIRLDYIYANYGKVSADGSASGFGTTFFPPLPPSLSPVSIAGNSNAQFITHTVMLGITYCFST